MLAALSAAPRNAGYVLRLMLFSLTLVYFSKGPHTLNDCLNDCLSDCMNRSQKRRVWACLNAKVGGVSCLNDLAGNLSLPGCWRATCVCHTQIVQCMCLSADISVSQQVLTGEDVGYCVGLDMMPCLPEIKSLFRLKSAGRSFILSE